MADQENSEIPDLSQLKLVSFTINDEIRDRCRNLCAEFLGGPWSGLKPDEITIVPVKDGLSNRIYACTNLKLPQCEESTLKAEVPSKVLVRLHGSEFVGDEGALIVVSKCALPLIGEVLHEKGLAAKIYGVFDEGRIEHFIESTKFPPEAWPDQQLIDCLTRKLAEIHQLEIPISKDPWSLMKMAQRNWKTSKETNPFLKVELYDLDLQPMVQKMLDFDGIAEDHWVRNMAPYIRSPCVYCHNDLHFGNVLSRSIEGTLDERVFVIDYDNSSYGFRGYDLALFLYLKSFVPGRLETWANQTITTAEEKRHAMEVYLEHLRKIRNNNIDPEIDTVEHLEREIDFGEVLIQFVFGAMGLMKMNPMMARLFSVMMKNQDIMEEQVKMAKARCEQYKQQQLTR